MRVLIFACAVALAGCADPPQEVTPRPPLSQSLEGGDLKLHKVSELHLSDTEILTMVVVPSPLMPDSASLSNTCLLYRNVAAGTATMQCDFE